MEKWQIGVFILVICLGMISAIWAVNNPKANQMTIFTHFNDAIHFRSLPEFQK